MLTTITSSVTSVGLRDYFTCRRVFPAHLVSLLPLKKQGKQEQLLIDTFELTNLSPPVCMPYNQEFVARPGLCGGIYQARA